MALSSSAGARLFIGPTTPAFSLPAYEALDFTEIGSVESLGDFGDTSALVAFTGLADLLTRKFKGARDAGEMPVMCGADPLDPGQLAAFAAQVSKLAYAFKVEAADAATDGDTNSTFYFHALVMSDPLNIGGVNDVMKRSFSLAIDSRVYSRLSAPQQVPGELDFSQPENSALIGVL